MVELTLAGGLGIKMVLSGSARNKLAVLGKF